jgi:hypothetical protein
MIRPDADAQSGHGDARTHAPPTVRDWLRFDLETPQSEQMLVSRTAVTEMERTP